jgi:hypothetical protein
MEAGCTIAFVLDGDPTRTNIEWLDGDPAMPSVVEGITYNRGYQIYPYVPLSQI